MTSALIDRRAPSRLARVRNAMTPAEWRRTIGMVGFVVLLHVLGFFLLLVASAHHYHLDGVKTFGVGTGLLAYTLGLRHAFDADHISAIDNTTRKLMSEGQRPLSTGFWFSLGHSSVVFGLTAVLGLGLRSLNAQVHNGRSGLHHYTGLVGTIVSGSFLYLIAALNVVILVSILRIFFGLRSGRYDHDELERQLNARGLMNRFFGPLARRVDSPWKMYPVGFLFGLGFDTATEIALLVLAGSSVASGLPFWAILSMPILFAAGMSLFDTLDGTFMNFAYGWAFSNPIRKVYYNITITGLSVGVAFVIGTIELLSVLQTELNLKGGLWDYAARFNINSAGFFIVGLFVVTWLVALAIWRFGHVEHRWEAAAQRMNDLTAPSELSA
ncbi:MAG TPA: HoxN/HupN/NixA family nickel/cobalt transporter [Acidimicrobiales bacterium]|nr:HoxN/HupN/NixA family nickel/cobalt transporter [Acidimicrobiales bacterium]